MPKLNYRATRIVGRYLVVDLFEQYGNRNGAEGELLV
jgi:hypothetical protein